MGSEQIDPIEHVVVLMLENRSFDQMLGDFQRIYPTLDGIAPLAPRRTNKDDAGVEYEQKPIDVRRASNDPNHELASVLRQIGAPPAARGSDCRQPFPIRLGKAVFGIACSWLRYWCCKAIRRTPQARVGAPGMRAYEGHFVAEHVRNFPNSTRSQRDEIMGYYEVDTLPALHFLARNFTVCDRWFASVPGPTWVNRFFVHTGTSRGIARMPNYTTDFEGYALHDQRTIYDELTAHGKKWRIYFHDIPQSLVLSNQLRSENKINYSPIDNLEADASGPASEFPAFVFIEPQYNGDDANDDHPPYDIMQGQALIARVYDALRANNDLWQSTLLVVVYDEHGGFYDHVEPLEAVPPDNCTLEYAFNRLGVRVPAVLISPWVAAGVFPADKNVHFDHTSIGKYLCERWGLDPLGKRMKDANSIGLALRLDQPARPDTPPKSAEVPTPQPTTVSEPNENQIALNALSEHLERRGKGAQKPKLRVMARNEKPDPGVIRLRVLNFLKQP